ncbi:MAG: uracil-DNA glycosylase [Candidatus Altiarchaeales archaeon]|nr:uracil-DNA glycosylase [Candidatus Altiarchaeales archaeon]
MDTISNISGLDGLIKDCTKCALHLGRTQAVPGVGNTDAELMLVGEGPGEEEDRQGLPFVGRCGQLLTTTLVEVGLNREDVFITNVVKCRPPKNRDPLPEEVAECQPFLKKQVELIKPKVIVALGRIAAAHLLGRSVKITKEHGSLDVLPFNEDVLASIIYHPSYVLRNRNTQIERDFHNDLLEARNIAYGAVAPYQVST